MIYVKLEGHSLQYEVEDIIKMFFNDRAVLFCEDSPPGEHRGIFIINRVLKNDDEYTFHTRIDNEGITVCDNQYKLAVSAFLNEDVKKGVKHEVKKQLYLILVEFTGKEQPWGILTGIRPAKIVHQMIDEGSSCDEISVKLKEYYNVSESKVELVCHVAENERRILMKTAPQAISIYIGIPFCPTRCLYCSFTSNPINRYLHLVNNYLDALKLEIDGAREIIERSNLQVQSIYIGGGTPTSIDALSLRTLLQFIEKKFDLRHLEEYTLEAGRPDSINRHKLEAIKNSRVDRVSINPQTMNNETLQLIGRDHTAEDIKDAYTLARQVGFNNINMDVIVGLPGETLTMFENTLKEIEALHPESLTVHTMAVKRASRLGMDKNKYQLGYEDETKDMINLAQQYAREWGMHPYYLYRQKNMIGNLENVGYCKPGFESVYNVQIMEEKQTIIALGAGAISKVVFPEQNRIERAFNVKTVEEYIKRVDEMIERKNRLLY